MALDPSKLYDEVNPPAKADLSKLYDEVNPPAKKKDRQDLLVKSYRTMKDALTNPDISFLKSQGGIAQSLLEGLGGVSQRAEAALANPILSLQEGNIRDAYGPAQLRALKGEQFGEYGDVLRNVGAPEPVAATAGLAASTVTDPLMGAMSVGRAVRRAVTSGSKKLAVLGGEKVVNTTLLRLQGQKPEVVDFLMNDQFRAASDSYKKLGAFKDPATSIASSVRRELYKPANAAYEKVAGQLGNKPVSRLDELVMNLDALQGSALGTEAELSKISRASKILEKLATEGTGEVPLREVLNIQRTLRRGAKSSVVDADAVRIIGSHLESQFPELVEANRKWNVYKDGLAIQEALGINVGKLSKRGVSVGTEGGTKLADYFADDVAVPNALNSLKSVFSRAKADTSKLDQAILKSQRISAIREFLSNRSSSPERALSRALGSAGTKLAAGSIGGGLGFAGGGPLGAAAGATAGFALTEPGVAAAGLKGAFETKKLLSTPLARTLALMAERTAGATIDPALQRQLTGRNE